MPMREAMTTPELPARQWRDSRPRIARPRTFHLPGRSAPPAASVARIPPGMRVYALGDVHGRADLARARLSQIEEDLRGAPPTDYRIIFLGDYIDRGPQSRQVVDLLIEAGGRHGDKLVCLEGNHEELFLEALADVNSAPAGDWVLNGGMQTLESYFGDEWAALLPGRGSAEHLFPQDHVRFLRGLKLSHRVGDYLFVHAGVDPALPWQEQADDPSILLWVRWKFLEWPDPLPFVVVHGHTPNSVVDMRVNRLNIDTGAYRSGNLSCVRMEDDEIILLGDAHE